MIVKLPAAEENDTRVWSVWDNNRMEWKFLIRISAFSGVNLDPNAMLYMLFL